MSSNAVGIDPTNSQTVGLGIAVGRISNEVSNVRHPQTSSTSYSVPGSSSASNSVSHAANNAGSSNISAQSKWLEPELCFFASIMFLATLARVVCQLKEFEQPQIKFLSWVITSKAAFYLLFPRGYYKLGCRIIKISQREGRGLLGLMFYLFVCGALQLIYFSTIYLVLDTNLVSDCHQKLRTVSALFTLITATFFISVPGSVELGTYMADRATWE